MRCTLDTRIKGILPHQWQKNKNGVIAQLVERFDGIEEVCGSIPHGSTIFQNKFNSLDNIDLSKIYICHADVTTTSRQITGSASILKISLNLQIRVHLTANLRA